jgi:hypothetical protein
MGGLGVKKAEICRSWANLLARAFPSGDIFDKE